MRPTTKKILGPNDFVAGGVNDTLFPDNRAPNQAKTMDNCRLLHDGTVEKTGGRSALATSFGSTGERINGISFPQEVSYLAEITDRVNSLYVKVGASYYTATLATGKYSTYDQLATALETALDAAVDGWTVTYNAAANYKFRIKYTGDTYVVAWNHNLTTLDQRLFGFQASATAASGVNSQSDFAVKSLPCTGKIVFIAGKAYTIAGNEVTYPNGDSLSLSTDQNISRSWANKRHYFSDNTDNYVMKDNFVREIVRPDDLKFTSSAWGAAADDLYNKTGTASSASMNRGVLIPLTAPGVFPTHGTIKLDISTFNYGVPFTLKFYVYIPGIGINYFFHEATIKDLTEAGCGAGGGANYPFTILPSCWLDSTLYNSFIAVIVDFDGPTPPITPPAIKYTNTAFSPHGYYEMSADGVWVQQDQDEICARVWRAAGTSASDIHSYKTTLYTSDGVETSPATEGRSIYTIKRTGGELSGGPFMSFARKNKADYDYINVYRNQSSGTTFYLVGQIPRVLAQETSAITINEGFADTDLIESTEAPTIVSDTDYPYSESCYWNRRLWIFRDNLLLFSDQDYPELFSAGQNIPLPAKGTAIAGLGDGSRGALYAFTINGYTIISDAGGVFQAVAGNSNLGCLSSRSCVPVRTENGDALMFQANDGHFYIAAYESAIPLSHGRIDTLVSTFNLAALTETAGFYDPIRREVRWSVCTGSATTPNKRVIYNLLTQGWDTDDNPADFWAVDTANDDYPGETVFVGAKARDLVYDDKGDANFDPEPLACTADASTDKITATAHGFSTASAIIFSTTAADLPDPLAEGTTYYAIVVDNDTIKAATSAANAAAGTAIDITDAGTGTHYVRGAKDITVTLATADRDFDDPEDGKQFQTLELSAYGETAGQTATVSWYMNCSATALESATITLSTSPTKHLIKLHGARGRYIRFEIVHQDAAGKIRINRAVVEYVLQPTAYKTS